MYKIEWQGKTIIIGQEFALKVVEAVTMNTEEAPSVEEPKERIKDEAQTNLTHYVEFRAPRVHARGWSSHCSRCGAEGRKCLERLNGRCHECKEGTFRGMLA